MSDRYFIGDEEMNRGPFSLEELRGMIDAGELRPTDLVRREGGSRWVPPGDLPELTGEAITSRPQPGGRDNRSDSFAPTSRRRTDDDFDDDEMPPSRRRRGDDDFDDDEVPSIRRREINYELITNFRRQIHALGGFWIFIGILFIVAAIFLIDGNQFLRDQMGKLPAGVDERLFTIVVGAVAAGMALMWIMIGILACLKFLGSVYVGLVLSYLTLAANLLSFNICGLIIWLIVILQAHRVITWACKLRRAGVPYDVKP